MISSGHKILKSTLFSLFIFLDITRGEEEGGWHASPLRLDLATDRRGDMHKIGPSCRVFSAISPSSSDPPLVKLPTPNRSSEGRRRQSRSVDDVEEGGGGRSRNNGGGKGLVQEEKRGLEGEEVVTDSPYSMNDGEWAELLTAAAQGCTGRMRETKEQRERERSRPVDLAERAHSGYQPYNGIELLQESLHTF